MLWRDFEEVCVKLFEELFLPPEMPLEEFDVTAEIQIRVEELELGKRCVFSAMSLPPKLEVKAFLPDPNLTDV